MLAVLPAVSPAGLAASATLRRGTSRRGPGCRVVNTIAATSTSATATNPPVTASRAVRPDTAAGPGAAGTPISSFSRRRSTVLPGLIVSTCSYSRIAPSRSPTRSKRVPNRECAEVEVGLNVIACWQAWMACCGRPVSLRRKASSNSRLARSSDDAGLGAPSSSLPAAASR